MPKTTPHKKTAKNIRFSDETLAKLDEAKAQFGTYEQAIDRALDALYDRESNAPSNTEIFEILKSRLKED